MEKTDWVWSGTWVYLARLPNLVCEVSLSPTRFYQTLVSGIFAKKSRQAGLARAPLFFTWGTNTRIAALDKRVLWVGKPFL